MIWTRSLLELFLIFTGQGTCLWQRNGTAFQLVQVRLLRFRTTRPLSFCICSKGTISTSFKFGKIGEKLWECSITELKLMFGSDINISWQKIAGLWICEPSLCGAESSLLKLSTFGILWAWRVAGFMYSDYHIIISSKFEAHCGLTPFVTKSLKFCQYFPPMHKRWIKPVVGLIWWLQWIVDTIFLLWPGNIFSAFMRGLPTLWRLECEQLPKIEKLFMFCLVIFYALIPRAPRAIFAKWNWVNLSTSVSGNTETRFPGPKTYCSVFHGSWYRVNNLRPLGNHSDFIAAFPWRHM